MAFYLLHNYMDFIAKKIQKFIFQSENIQQFRIEPISLNDIFLERVGE